jgi:hypothetical protein
MVAVLPTLTVVIATVVAGSAVDGPLMAEITAVDAAVPDVSEVTYQQKFLSADRFSSTWSVTDAN